MSKTTEEVKVNKYWILENDVARSFNRLKGKLFNLVEASVLDKTAQEAVKGLMKGFANDEYNRCIDMMRDTAEDMGLIEKGQAVPNASLESMPA